MSKSILVKEYNKANIFKKETKIFTQVIDVSFLDVLKENEVEVFIKDYKDCLCKDSKNLKDYFVVCNKCEGKGTINLNNHQVICNECKGEKYLRIHDCYMCDNEGKMLLDAKIKIKLTKDMDNGSELIIDKKDYKLILKINVFNKENYLIKDNDIYYLKSIKYSKEDFKNRVSKEVITFKGKREFKSEFKVKKEIVKVEKEGINNGDFYFIFENEVENEKKEIYTNVLIDESGYVDIHELINNKIVIAKKSIALNLTNYLYIDSNVDEYEDDEYVIKLKKFDLKEFEINDSIYYLVNLEKDDLLTDKKSININEDKVNLSFKKNLKEVICVEALNKGFVNKEGKKEGIKIKVNPYYENVYKISIKNNKKTVYIDDYKYDDYRLVESFRKSDYLKDYVKIDEEESIVVNNDLILIKRI